MNYANQSINYTTILVTHFNKFVNKILQELTCRYSYKYSFETSILRKICFNSYWCICIYLHTLYWSAHHTAPYICNYSCNTLKSTGKLFSSQKSQSNFCHHIGCCSSYFYFGLSYLFFIGTNH